jgi:hypothetical protein
MIAEDLVEIILEKDNFTKNIFLGCLARNEIPTNPPYPCCFVLNNEPRSQPGEHWIALYYNKYLQTHGICLRNFYFSFFFVKAWFC